MTGTKERNIGVALECFVQNDDRVISYTAVYKSGNEMIEFLLENSE